MKEAVLREFLSPRKSDCAMLHRYGPLMNGIEQAFSYYRYLSQHKARRKLKSIVSAIVGGATLKFFSR